MPSSSVRAAPHRPLITGDEVGNLAFSDPHRKLAYIKEVRDLWSILKNPKDDGPRHIAARDTLRHLTDLCSTLDVARPMYSGRPMSGILPRSTSLVPSDYKTTSSVESGELDESMTDSEFPTAPRALWPDQQQPRRPSYAYMDSPAFRQPTQSHSGAERKGESYASVVSGSSTHSLPASTQAPANSPRQLAKPFDSQLVQSSVQPPFTLSFKHLPSDSEHAQLIRHVGNYMEKMFIIGKPGESPQQMQEQSKALLDLREKNAELEKTHAERERLLAKAQAEYCDVQKTMMQQANDIKSLKGSIAKQDDYLELQKTIANQAKDINSLRGAVANRARHPDLHKKIANQAKEINNLHAIIARDARTIKAMEKGIKTGSQETDLEATTRDVHSNESRHTSNDMQNSIRGAAGMTARQQTELKAVTRDYGHDRGPQQISNDMEKSGNVKTDGVRKSQQQQRSQSNRPRGPELTQNNPSLVPGQLNPIAPISTRTPSVSSGLECSKAACTTATHIFAPTEVGGPSKPFQKRCFHILKDYMIKALELYLQETVLGPEAANVTSQQLQLLYKLGVGKPEDAITPYEDVCLRDMMLTRTAAAEQYLRESPSGPKAAVAKRELDLFARLAAGLGDELQEGSGDERVPSASLGMQTAVRTDPRAPGIAPHNPSQRALDAQAGLRRAIASMTSKELAVSPLRPGPVEHDRCNRSGAGEGHADAAAGADHARGIIAGGVKRKAPVTDADEALRDLNGTKRVKLQDEDENGAAVPASTDPRLRRPPHHAVAPPASLRAESAVVAAHVVDPISMACRAAESTFSGGAIFKRPAPAADAGASKPTPGSASAVHACEAASAASAAAALHGRASPWLDSRAGPLVNPQPVALGRRYEQEAVTPSTIRVNGAGIQVPVRDGTGVEETVGEEAMDLDTMIEREMAKLAQRGQ